MTKQAFLEELRRLTGGLSAGEQARLIDYYSEMIDDRMEEGIPEAEAVAALGSPADIAGQFAPAPQSAPAQGASETVSALNHLRVQVANADVSIVREPIPGGAAAQLRFSDPARFEWRVEGDLLEVTELPSKGEKFSLHWLRQMISEPSLRVTVALAGPLAGGLECTVKGGDLTADGLEVGGESRLHAGSGDIKLTHAAFAAGLEAVSNSGDLRLDDLKVGQLLRVRTSSGDAEASNLAAGELWLESASGDISLRQSEGGALTIATASGDIEVDRCRTGAASFHAASGEVRLDELEADPSIIVETASGDIDMTRCIARDILVKAASGDVGMRLEPLPCGYDITANTVAGDISLPRHNPKTPGEPRPKIGIRTASGDIEVRIL